MTVQQAAYNEQTRQQVLTVAKTYSCMSQYNDMVQLFSNPNNTAAVAAAVEIYGVPPRNGIDNNGNYHSEWCSWDLGMYKFYLATRLFTRFTPFDVNAKENCKRLSETKIALENEILNADRDYKNDLDQIKHTYQVQVIQDYQSKIIAASATNTCTATIADEYQQQSINILNQTASTPVEDTTNNTTQNIVKFIVIGLVVLVVIKLLKR